MNIFAQQDEDICWCLYHTRYICVSWIMTVYTFGLSHPIIFFVFTHFLAKRFYPKETLYLCLLLCNWLSIPLEFLLAFVSLAMIVFVTRTIFVFVGKLLSTYATIVCRYICAFCNDCICFQNNLCICACWQVVGCHSDRSDGTLAYSTRLPSLLVAHLQKPIARRTSTNICNGIRDTCNGHAKKYDELTQIMIVQGSSRSYNAHWYCIQIL